VEPAPRQRVDDEEDLAERYGRGPDEGQRRRRTVAIAVVVALLGLAAVVWLAFGAFSVPVRTMDRGFDIIDATAIDVTFVVVKDAEATVTCRVHALNPSFAEVGVKDVLVGPAEDSAVQLTTRVATSELATTGLVQWCEVVEP
jgi:hypothetical protein